MGQTKNTSDGSETEHETKETSDAFEPPALDTEPDESEPEETKHQEKELPVGTLAYYSGINLVS